MSTIENTPGFQTKVINYDSLIYSTGSISPSNFSLTVYLVACNIQVCQVSLAITLIFCSYSKRQIFEKRGTFGQCVRQHQDKQGRLKREDSSSFSLVLLETFAQGVIWEFF